MQAFSNLDPNRLIAFVLITCYILVALGIVKIALYVLMTLAPGVWEALIKKENAFYIRIGLLGDKGSETYKKFERSRWTKAIFGCGGLATIFLAILVIAFVIWIQSLPFWEY